MYRIHVWSIYLLDIWKMYVHVPYMDPIYDIYHTLEGVEPPKCLSKLVGIQNWDGNKPVLETAVKLVNQPLKTCWPRTSWV